MPSSHDYSDTDILAALALGFIMGVVVTMIFVEAFYCG